MRKIIPYQPYLKKLANKLRKESTKSEIELWSYLKKKQMLGYDFHRQKPIDNYIVDFYCCDLLLAIELDGITHTYKETILKDDLKEKKLMELGVTVLRFNDIDVLKNTDWVIETIKDKINEIKPTPAPPREGTAAR